MANLTVGFKALKQGGQKIAQTICGCKNTIPSLQEYAKATKIMTEAKQGVVHELKDLQWATGIMTAQGNATNVAQTVCRRNVIPTLEEYNKATKILIEAKQGVVHELKDLEWATNILGS